jgi:thiol:disulfide interchange protein
MPIGSIFGCMFFGSACSLLGVRLLVHPSTAAKAAGLLVVALGAALTLGLLQRATWARWLGALAAALALAVSLRLVASGGDLGDHVLLLASLLTTLLLVLPATGDPVRGGAPPPRAGIGALGWSAVASFAGALVLAVQIAPAPGAVPVSRELPAAAVGRQVRWHDFGEGVRLAAEQGKPVLATFITDWCPYCDRMGQEAWRSPAVLERMDEVVTVRVDAEEQQERNGYRGAELARRYEVRGYPVQLLLDAEGRVLARHDGYQEPGQLVAWLDRGLDGRDATPAARTTVR